MTPTEAKSKIKDLVSRFEYHLDEYKKGHYNETQTRTDYINPFFEALGWDINNRQGLAESYREVIHEDKVKVGGATKAPDYCFTVYGLRKFFVESKQPSVNILSSIDPAYQLRRYGWSAKLPVSILTDFEEFSVYDCTVKPLQTDKAAVARVKYMHYKDYITNFDFLWETFSKEHVLKGSFDKFVVTGKGKTGTAGVDAEFLKSLDGWRDLIARNIVNRNPAISEDELNYSLQKIIDRMIFLRICEDRGVELERTLFKTIGAGTYDRLKELFHSADLKYNSGLFDYKKDTLTDNLIIDDKILKSVIEDMYYPKSPYEFSVIPVEILGHSYEQYLGKVIRISPGHRIIIEEKPEVRKAGGVYYTPQYIVDYIVTNTVGKLTEGKTPDEVAKLKICDPACGSGSFLLGAYQFLLEWHREYYTANAIKNKDKYLTPDGNLSTAIKKQILLNNIYGVDIDTNAVEVTKLSLMLKAMEGETSASINQQLTFLRERILPTLDNNIKSGNSLIDVDFYDSQMDFEPGAEKKIKPFNWQSAFPEVFKQGGFDAVIGNPPYYLVEDSVQKEYFKKKFKTLLFKINLFTCFCEFSLKILKFEGKLSFIIPNLLFANNSLYKLRELLLKTTRIEKLINLGDGVFNKVSMPTMIFVVNNSINTDNIIDLTSNMKFNSQNNILQIQQTVFLSNFNFVFDTSNNDSMNLRKKLDLSSISVEDVLSVNQGVITGDDKKYLSMSKINEMYKQTIRGKDISRYHTNYPNLFVNYDRRILACPRTEDLFDVTEKLLMRRTGDYPIVSYDNEKTYNLHTLYSCRNLSSYPIKYLLGLLNSKLLKFLYTENLGTEKGRTFAEIKIVYIRKLPIPKTPNNDNIFELVSLVETMLQLNKDLQKATVPEQKEQLKARIEYTDKQIDALVYELYGLSEEEIKIVEGK